MELNEVKEFVKVNNKRTIKLYSSRINMLANSAPYVFKKIKNKSINNRQLTQNIEMEILKNTAITALEEATKLSQFIANEYEQLLSKEQSYIGVAQKLGIYFERRIQSANLKQEVSTINERLRQTARRIRQSKQNRKFIIIKGRNFKQTIRGKIN